MKHMVDKIVFKTGEVSVSTIDLTETGFGSAIETCIFYPGGDSEVVASYPNAEEAEAGHKAFCNPDVIRFVRRSMIDRQCPCPKGVTA